MNEVKTIGVGKSLSPTETKMNREIRRGVRHIVMIHPVDETSIVTELEEIATTVQVLFKMLIFRKMLGAV